MPTDVLLWDFGDTLVDELWMHRSPEGCPEWGTAWVESMGTLADDWNVGALASQDVFADMARRTGMTIDAVAHHAHECCSKLVFHPNAWRVASERRRRQAIVTVNPDLFTDVIVPVHALTHVFDVIVCSATEGTTRKVDLCLRALDELGGAHDPGSALLIDNRRDLVDDWRAVEGAGYWFRGDDAFARDLPTLLQCE